MAEVGMVSLDGSFVRKHLTGQDILRPTVINWRNEIATVVDTYLQHRGMVHGVQKDAVQNSWDARVDKKKGRNWSLTFELIEAKNASFFLFADRGTTGLTGKVLKREEMNEDLPEEERWRRFEGLAFTKAESGEEEAPLGSRGRGKFIFVGASRIFTILYDTLRKDGVYRLGIRWVEPTESPVTCCENEDAKRKLAEMTDGQIQPLTEVGTRVIIVNPVEELVKSIKSGEFVNFIGETWWEIIEKYQAKILVRYDNREIQATRPKDFQLPLTDSNEYLVWVRQNEKQTRGNVPFFVKKLQIVSNRKKSVPDELRGVAVQRGGMKVCCVTITYIPQKIADTLYGFLTLDDAAENELRRLEDPEHYSFDFSRGVARAIRDYIKEEMEKFAKEKLGWGADIRQIKRAKQQEAERQAIWAINRIAKKLGILGKVRTKTKRHAKEGRKWKKIRLRFAELAFPREDTIRVDWGQELKDILVEAVNDSDKPISFKLKIFVRFYDKVIKALLEKDVQLNPMKCLDVFGPHTERIERKSYADKGRYFIVAKMTSLMDDDKGAELDEIKQAFYVEKNPPQSGIFEKCEAIKTDPTWIGTVEEGSEGGWSLIYNIDHPSYLAIEDKEETQTDYLFKLGAHGICIIDLKSKKPKLFEDIKQPVTDLSNFANKLLYAIGKIMYEYNS
jgi:hypothetical protein